MDSFFLLVNIAWGLLPVASEACSCSKDPSKASPTVWVFLIIVVWSECGKDCQWWRLSLSSNCRMNMCCLWFETPLISNHILARVLNTINSLCTSLLTNPFLEDLALWLWGWKLLCLPLLWPFLLVVALLYCLPFDYGLVRMEEWSCKGRW